MRLHAFDKSVAIQKAAAGFEEIVDCPIAGEDLFRVPQILEGEALGEIIDALVTEHQAELLAAEGVAQ